MRILSRFGGPIITIIVVGVCIFALKTAPSMLWPERSRSLVKDEGFQAGHQTIGINERALERDSKTLLFSLLKKWRYDRERPAPPPERVREYDGRFVRIVGFMYPLESGREISTFCLLRSTQTCCYGPRPQYNQYVLVEMEHAVRFERLRPVQVEGAFFIDPRPDEGFIYRMDGTKVSIPAR